MLNNYFTNSNTVSSDRVIYTPSSFARSSLLHLQETGTLQAMAVHKSSRSKLPSYLFFTVLAGAGELIYNDVPYRLSPGDCVFIDCRLPYSHTTSDNLWTLSWVHFQGPDMQAIYDKYQARGGRVVFHPDRIKDYQNLLKELYQTAQSNSYVRDMEINCVLSKLMVLLMEDSWSPDHNEIQGKRAQIRGIKEYLDQNYALHISLDDLAEKFFINKFYLSEMFKEQYGIPVNDYLISVRITEAKKLLRFSDKTMIEIADSIGVNGVAYFSRLFKKVEGMSPSAYRKTWSTQNPR